MPFEPERLVRVPPTRLNCDAGDPTSEVCSGSDRLSRLAVAVHVVQTDGGAIAAPVLRTAPRDGQRP